MRYERLLSGDWQRVHEDEVAIVAAHYFLGGLALFGLGCALDRRGAGGMAAPFYTLSVAVVLAAGLSAARFGTVEWFGQHWDWKNEVWNLWLLSCSLPLLVAAWSL